MTTSPAFLLALLLAQNPAPVREPVPDPAAFQEADAAQKRATLNALAGGRYAPAPATAAGIIRSGLADTDPEVRRSAVAAVAGRAAGPRFSRESDAVQKWQEERASLLALRPAVLAALGDADDRVRQGAVIALVNLAFDPARSPKPIQLDAPTTAALAARYPAEESGRVRAEILKTLALTDADPSARNTLATAALDDSDLAVVAYAVMALARTHPPQVLPRLVALTGSADRNVRLQVAQTLSGYGALAAPHLPALRAAAEKETLPEIKYTLDAAIAAIVAAGPRR